MGTKRSRKATLGGRSMKSGSVDNLKVFARCGLTPNRANQRCTVLLPKPSARASARPCGMASLLA